MTLFTASLTDRLVNLVQRYRAQVDYLAIRLEESEGTDILLRGDRLETLSEGLAQGGQVRACHRGGWGFASFNQLDRLEQRIEEAIAAARIVGQEDTHLAPIEIIQGTYHLPLTGTDPRQISLAQKKALCEHYADLLRSEQSCIATVSVRYGDSRQRTLFVTSEGTCLEQSWVDLEMRFAATARRGETVQTGRETIGSDRKSTRLNSSHRT